MAEPKTPPDERIKRRTAIDPGDYERVLIGIIDYLAEREAGPTKAA